MTTREAAAYLQRSPGTLKRWRHTGNGPPFSRMNRAPRYSKKKLDEWLESREGQCPDDFKPHTMGGR